MPWPAAPPLGLSLKLPCLPHRALTHYPPPPPPAMPSPLQAAQPMPSHCPPDGKCQREWHFVTDSNRPQPVRQPPPTACLTAFGAASECLPVQYIPAPAPPPRTLLPAKHIHVQVHPTWSWWWRLNTGDPQPVGQARLGCGTPSWRPPPPSPAASRTTTVSPAHQRSGEVWRLRKFKKKKKKKKKKKNPKKIPKFPTTQSWDWTVRVFSFGVRGRTDALTRHSAPA